MKLFFFDPVSILSLRRARRAAGPLMAQALYEPLSQAEEHKLQLLVERHPELAQEFESLKAFLPRITLQEDDWCGDLMPALRAQIEEQALLRRGVFSRRGINYVFVASALLLGCGLYAFFMLAGDNRTGTVTPSPLRTAQSASALQNELLAVHDFMNQGRYQEAAARLAQEVKLHPDDPAHADALLQLADIQYTHLQQYDKAYESYKELERSHRPVFNSHWDSNRQLRLLSAALPLNFQPLASLEAAARAESPLHAYEHILTEYPEEIWGEEALRAMTLLVSDGSGEAPDQASALQRLSGMCTEPVALDRICLEIGHCYSDRLANREQARDYFRRAAESRHLALANCAREALAHLE